jgi:cobalamin biosynthesis Mg chelatase CobN
VPTATPQAPDRRVSLIDQQSNDQQSNGQQSNGQQDSNGSNSGNGSNAQASNGQASKAQTGASAGPSKTTKAPAAPRRPAKSQIVALPSRIAQVGLTAGTLPLLLLGLVAILGLLLVIAGTRRGMLTRKS